MYIRYFCPFSQNFFEGYLFLEQDGLLYICDDFTYFICENLNKTSNLSKNICRIYISNEVCYEKSSREINENFVLIDEVLKFNFFKYEIDYLNFICNFFSIVSKDTSKSLFDKVKNAFQYIENYVPEQIKEDLFSFLLEEIAGADRVKFLLKKSEIIK